ncbi:hypothetical protein N431DRAFT_326696 [Stipitochalara longipes BDJ]|nr:hypothetical protein N431DRAFT_326696 [Stipitochalara longipes BDJ]
MPSRGNPNVPNKQRRIASRAKVQKRNAVNKISKNPRGTARSSVLLPNSGPLAPPSGKKARKLEKARNHARQRAVEKAMAQEGEVQMTDAPKTTKSKTTKKAEDQMDVDGIS